MIEFDDKNKDYEDNCFLYSQSMNYNISCGDTSIRVSWIYFGDIGLSLEENLNQR